jgi:hypothetical protein
MPKRRSRPRASKAEFRGGGAARHWGDDPDNLNELRQGVRDQSRSNSDALERQALLEALNADDEILRGEMPFSPGSVLGVARRVPEWLRRLRRGPRPGAYTPVDPATQKPLHRFSFIPGQAPGPSRSVFGSEKGLQDWAQGVPEWIQRLRRGLDPLDKKYPPASRREYLKQGGVYGPHSAG